MKTFTFKIPYPPSVNDAWFNRPQKGRVKTTLYKEWEHSAGWLIKSQKPIKFNGPVSIFYTFGKKSRRFDMSNFIKPIEDLLVKLDIIEDDNSEIIEDFHVNKSNEFEDVRVSIVSVEMY